MSTQQPSPASELKAEAQRSSDTSTPSLSAGQPVELNGASTAATSPGQSLTGEDAKYAVGAAPVSADQSPHSVPASRRASAMPNDMASVDDQRVANANRRSMNGSLGDLASTFERMGVENGKHQQQDQSNRSGAGRLPVGAGIMGGSVAGQQSLLQRAMGRSGIEHGGGNASAAGNLGGAGEGAAGGMTPSFNERFLFSDDELEDDSTFVKKYNLNEDDTSFPVLIRRDSHPSLLSASSAALDLAPLSQTPPRFPPRSGDASVSEWPQFASDGRSDGEAPHGLDGAESFDRFAQRKGRSERSSPRVSSTGTPRSSMHMTTAPGTPVGAGRHQGEPGSAPRSATGPHFGGAPGSQQRLGSHGFGPRGTDRGTMEERAGKDQSKASAQDKDSGFSPFGGMGAFGSAADGKRGAADPTQGRFAPPYSFEGRNNAGPDAGRGSQGYFEAFAPPPMNKAGGNAQKQPSGFGSGTSGAGPASGGNYGFGIGPDSAQLGSASAAAAAAAAGLNGLKVPRKGELDTSTPLEDLQGEIFALCKDQHGCRYLQKKLEEGSTTHRDMIFTETFPHFAELMTDPFGNYLCQKMLEFCTDDQRNLIVESVSPELVTISLNMHGTRAVQKTIDCLSTTRQIHSIIMALSMNVVPLIKDLNGNHVIQKCLNRLSSTDNQFIYDAVASHCVEVATHRHGCCVLQRCIDHASDKQRMQLVQEITYNALTLVQDPFGNYVVQYILDLNDARCSEAIIRQFVGHVCTLSVQKFSSNVIEKCIRVSDPAVRKLLVDELLNRTRLEKLLRDSFANYVVQTSLDYADPVQRMQLVECIKPILPMIRNTPYGKRIQSKLQRENIDLGPGPANVPYGLLQAAQQQQQLQAMAAMAQRQGPSGDFAAAMAPGPYSPAGMHGGGAGRGFVRGGMSPMGPPDMYGGGGGRGVGAPVGAAGPGGAPPHGPGAASMYGSNGAVPVGGGGAGGMHFGRRGGGVAGGGPNNHPHAHHHPHGAHGAPPHMVSNSPHLGFPPQQAYAMQGGFGPGPAGGASFANQYSGQF